MPKVARHSVKGQLHCRLALRVGFEFKASDLAICNSARDNPLKVAQVRRYVEGEAVRRDALGDMHADGGDFFFSNATLRR